MRKISLLVSSFAAAGLLACGTSTNTPATTKKTVGIVINEGTFITEWTAPWDVYKHLPADLVDVYLIAETMAPVTNYDGAKVVPHFTFDNHPKIDILVVPSGEHSLDTDLENGRLIDWIRTTASTAEYVTSNCWGAFKLGAAGLLDGKRVTTFPGYTDMLKEKFPAIGEVVSNQRFVVDGNLITSNGGLSSFESALYLVEKIWGQEEADKIAVGIVYATENRAYSKNPMIGTVPSTMDMAPATMGTKNVGIYLPETLFIHEATGPWTIYKHTGDKMNVFFVSQTGQPITTWEGAVLHADYSFDNHPPIDVLVVGSSNRSMKEELDNTALTAWIQRVAPTAEWVTSHCWGAFALAKAGVLDGKKVTTFPGYTDELDAMFPAIESVTEERRIVEDGNVMTSAGGLAAFEAPLTIVRKYYGDVQATLVAQDMVFSQGNFDNSKNPLVVTP